MYGPRRLYAKNNKSLRERKIPYELFYMWNLKNKGKNNPQSKLTDIENRLVGPIGDARGGEGGGGRNG